MPKTLEDDLLNIDPCRQSWRICSCHNDKIDPENRASRKVWGSDNMRPDTIDRHRSIKLPNKSSGTAILWLEACISSRWMLLPYLLSISFRRCLCHCAASDSVENNGVVLALKVGRCGVCCWFNLVDCKGVTSARTAVFRHHMAAMRRMTDNRHIVTDYQESSRREWQNLNFVCQFHDIFAPCHWWVMLRITRHYQYAFVEYGNTQLSVQIEMVPYGKYS